MKRMFLRVFLVIGLALPLSSWCDDEVLKLSSDSFVRAIEKDLRDPEYQQDILPNDFSYLTQMLDHGRKTRQSRLHARSIFRMFGNILKGAQYVSADAFSNLLEMLPAEIEEYFMLYKSLEYLPYKAHLDLDMFDRFKQSVDGVLYRLNSEYDRFRQDPELFLDELSHQICDIAQEEVSMEQLRHTVIHFLDIALNKLSWDATQPEKAWKSVKKISHQIADLMESNIIDDVNDLDDLYWSLIHRFCYILDITGDALTLDFYQKIKHDINHESLLLLDLDEQVEFIESKPEYLMRKVMHAEARKRAYDQGMIIK